jgi:hypothetical protein
MSLFTSKWTSLKGRFDKLPLVLAGPILRRVEKTSVSVWLALREETSVQLKVFEFDTGNPNPILWSQEQSETLVKLGPHLYIVCVTADQSDGGRHLLTDQVYTYGMLFKDGLELATAVGPNCRLGYEDRDQDNPSAPSFVLPSADRTKLRLAQGS